MKSYSKLIAAVVGVGAMLVSRHAGIDMGVIEPQIVDAIIAALTAAGVWTVSNS